MSWESTIEYYRLVNELVAEQLGGLHSADCILRSVDFTEIEVLQRENRWSEAGERLAREAQNLEAAESSKEALDQALGMMGEADDGNR